MVVGVFVYSLFSKSGALGSLDLLFTVEAMIFAQTCLILPLVWGGSWTAFEGVGKTSSDTLATLGINERQRLFLEIRLASITASTTPSSSPSEEPSLKWEP